MTRWVYNNGQYLRPTMTAISIYDRGVLFGDAAYEVIPVLDRTPVDGNLHLDRLERSLNALDIPLPRGRGAMNHIVQRLIDMNRLTSGLVYFQASRGVQTPRTHLPAANLQPILFGFAHPMRLTWPNTPPNGGDKGIALCSIADTRWQHVWIKTTNLLPNCLAKAEAVAKGYHDAVLFDAETETIHECTSSNIWMITYDNVLVTRPADGTILNGITRQTILMLARQNGLAIEERSFTRTELRAAKEVFVTSATQFVAAVTSIDDHRIGNAFPGEKTQRIMEHYHDYIKAPN